MSSITIGNGGWVRHEGDGPTVTFIRFDDDGHGRLRPMDVLLTAAGPVLTNDLRTVPLGMIEGWVNDREVSKIVRDHLCLAGPLLREAATYFSTTVNFEHPKGSHWVGQMLGSQIPGSGIPPAPARPLRSKRGQTLTAVDDPDLRIEEPAGRPYGDEFYRKVVRTYQAAAKASDQPNKLIADTNNLPVTTVRGWVRTARKRGLMAPGRVGSVG